MISVTKLIATAATLALVPHSGDAATWTVPLRQHRESTHQHRELKTSPLLWNLRVPATDLATSHGGSVWARLFSTPHVEAVIETDFKNVGHGAYVTEVGVGTPPQRVALALDLNTADVAMLNHKVGPREFYDHHKSSSYIANGTKVMYGPDIKGFVSSDQLVVAGGDGSGLKVPHFPIVELVEPDALFKYFEPGMSGWLGLGPGRANSTGTRSIIHSMIAEGLLDRPMVGVSFAKSNTHVTFGGIDSKYKDDDVTFFPASMTTESWGVPVSGVRVDGKSVVESSTPAMLIGGLDVLFGPADQVDAIADAVGAENYALPCAGKGPDITFHLGTLAITLTKADYAIPIKDGICELMIQPTGPSSQHWFIGSPLLNRVYVVLDYGSSGNEPRAGLAPLKSTA